MSLSIQSSYASLVTENSLSTANNKLTTAMTRLSTGYQVNSSSDDAAGLSIATRMQSTSDGIDVATDNISDATSMLDTADSALSTMNDIAGRMKDLATQASNGTYSSDDISAMSTEYGQLSSQLTDIMNNTQYGGDSLLDSSGKLGTSVTFQVGASSSETLGVDVSSALSSITTAISAAGTALTATTANSMIDSMTALISDISNTRSSIGASVNRLDYTSENISNEQETTDQAVSNIMDADYASETANMSKQELLEKAGISVLSGISSSQSLISNLLG